MLCAFVFFIAHLKKEKLAFVYFHFSFSFDLLYLLAKATYLIHLTLSFIII